MNALDVLTISGIGVGYEMVNLLPSDDVPVKIECCELFPVADGAVLILRGEKSSLTKFIAHQSAADLIHSVLIEEYSEFLLRTFFSLESAPLADFLVVGESQFLGSLFQLGAEALKAGFGIIDLKAARGGQRTHQLFLTKSADKPLPAQERDRWLHAMKRSGSVKITLVDNPNPQVKSFFSS